MSTTLEDALEEEAYARMADDVISAHKDDIISDFVSERMKSYYLNNPHLTAPAEAAIEEAYRAHRRQPYSLTGVFQLSN